MNLDLTNKVAFISGSSKGIGKAIAKQLYDEGCIVILNGRDQKDLSATAAELPGSFAIVADVTDPSETDKVADYISKKIGRLDIVVCNVGSGRSVPPGEESFSEWQRMLSLNLLSTTNLVESCKQLLSASAGNIVCISSICGHETIDGAPVTYSVAKAALNTYVKSISRVLGKLNIRINAIEPGNILFEGSVWERKLAEAPEQVQHMLNNSVSLSKLGVPEDIASLVAYLVSSRASFATGSVWTLDGGQVKS